MDWRRRRRRGEAGPAATRRRGSRARRGRPGGGEGIRLSEVVAAWRESVGKRGFAKKCRIRVRREPGGGSSAKYSGKEK